MTGKTKFSLSIILVVGLYFSPFSPTCSTNNLQSLGNNLGAKDMEVVNCCLDKLFAQYQQAALLDRKLIMKQLVDFLLLPERSPSLMQYFQYADDMDDYYNKQSELYSKAVVFMKEQLPKSKEERFVVIQQLQQVTLSPAQQNFLKQLKTL